ncbi:Predicted arabinose efflux permease, MFS family [Marinospirillum celere]|uniref:Predicted arabinose efflux permease, MFS family n=1 Tax=Marinospirillum celere TaxID=1122252 RepID=A0A1I1E8Z0_9GAMM|nr:MFS transporter [Marinospirillum celere]SFB81778.1 Predicted arabinose efflux permease, MFS family [Marinospirillum celere]
MISSTGSGYLTLIRQHFGFLALAFLAVFTGNLGQSFFIGLFQAPLSEQLNLSAGQFGSIYAAVTLVSGFLVLRLGPSIDWVAPRRYALLVLLGLTLGVLLLTSAPWWWAALIGLGLVRLCGQGLMTHLGSTLTGREFTYNRGRALGLVSLGMPLGEILLPPAVALLLIWLGWQQLWWLLLAIFLIFWCWAWFQAPWPQAPQQAPIKGEKPRGPNPLKELRFWLLLPLLLALPIIMTGIFIYQAQLTHDLNASLTTYALALTGMGVARLPGALLGGRWVDQWGVEHLARVYLIPFILGLLAASMLQGNWGIWLLMLGAGFAMGMQGPILDSLLVSLWGSEHLGRVRSVKSACMVFSTAIAPALLGFLLDWQVSFVTLLMGMLAFVVFAILLALQPIREAANHAPQ